MANRNGDDVVASLMAEMGKVQGYKKIENSVPSQEKKRQRRRLVPELGDYPDNSRTVGSHSIWNPYVKLDNLPSSSFLPTLPTNPQVEVIRRRTYEKFKQGFYELLERIQGTLKIKLQIPALLEKWQMDCKLQEYQTVLKKKENRAISAAGGRIIASTPEIRNLLLMQNDPEQKIQWMDPILLSKLASSTFSQAFKVEFKKAYKDQKKGTELQLKQQLGSAKLGRKCQHMQKAIHKFIAEGIDYFEKEISLIATREALQPSSSKKIPKIQRDNERNQMKVTFLGLSFSVHVAHYEKLQRLFDRASESNAKGGNQDATFEEVLFCLLCRYDMLQGAGLQASLPGGVLDVLLEHLDCRMECFASPLNCRTQNFGSAFDLDRFFGTVGSFFTCNFDAGGCYQANPPFCEELIHGMCKKLDEDLEQTQKSKTALMFVIFVPVWKESKGYQSLTGSTFLTEHVVMQSGHHWYAEGTQHRRKDTFRAASFDTSIFFYQNEAAKSKWPITEEILEQLKASFTDDPRNDDPASAKTGSKQKIKLTTNEPPKIEPPPAEAKVEEKKEQDFSTANNRLDPKPSAAASKAGANNKKGKEGLNGKKRKWNDAEEGKAQLDLLHSLGLAKEEPKTEENLLPSKGKSNGKAGSHKPKQKKKKGSH
jgi:hypothetical protein